MQALYSWLWVILLVIGITAAIKIIITIQKNNVNTNSSNHSNTNTSSLNNQVVRNSNITETGPIVYFANDRHGRRDREYQFNYKKINGSWRAYILRMPNLGNRESSGLVTHRLYDNGRPYVCWDHQVNSLDDMQTISKVWADSIQEYIATGKRFG